MGEDTYRNTALSVVVCFIANRVCVSSCGSGTCQVCDFCDQVCLKWNAEDTADSEVNAFQLLVDGAPVGEPLKKPARQVTIDDLKPGQELDVSLVPLDSNRQPLGSSNVVKARAFCTLCLNYRYINWADYNDHKL